MKSRESSGGAGLIEGTAEDFDIESRQTVAQSKENKITGQKSSVEMSKDIVDEIFHQKTGTPDLLEHIENQESGNGKNNEFRTTTQVKSEWPKAPELKRDDMLTPEGKYLDFKQAKSYPELIEMISQQDYIVNQLGQKVEPESVINLIYKLTYQDLRDYQKEDWTSITLRHNLRSSVADLIRDYKKTPEFQSLIGLDLSKTNTKEEVFNLIRQKGNLINATGQKTDAESVISDIEQGHLHNLPSLLKYKMIEINKRDNLHAMVDQGQQATSTVNNFRTKIKSGLAKLKFWGK